MKKVKSKKLEKLAKEGRLAELVEPESRSEYECRTLNEDLMKKVREALVEEYGERTDIHGNNPLASYDPVIEMAKLAHVIGIEDSLKYQLNREVASYMYPKVKSLEIRGKTDNNLNITINIEGYARKDGATGITPEDFVIGEDDGSIRKKDYMPINKNLTRILDS